MTIVILGAEGSLGKELQRVFPKAKAFSHQQVDITYWDDLTKLRSLQPTVIINAAAYTDVEGAQRNKDLAFLVNYQAIVFLHRLSEETGARLIHFSTDYVFDGQNKEGYKENSVRNPLNTYGKSKAAGEEFLEQKSQNYLLIRTSWLYGSKKSFPHKIIAKAKTESTVKVVADQWGSPTSAADLAKSIPALLELPSGIYHLTNQGVCNWYEFACTIFEQLGMPNRVVPVSSIEFPTQARRPEYSVLLNTKTQPLRNWKLALVDYLKAEKLR